MIHVMKGDWQLFDIQTQIDCSKVYTWISLKRLSAEFVNINDIGYKPLDKIHEKDDRYVRADINLPGIVVKGMKNPYNKPYRMIDGRHRLLKNKRVGNSQIKVYVIEEQQALKFIS